MKFLKWILFAVIFFTVLIFGIDFYLNPGAYISQKRSSKTDSISTVPTHIPLSNQSNVRIPSPTTPPPPTLVPSVPKPQVISPLDLESVHQLIRDREDKGLAGQSFVWTFSDLSEVVWEPCLEFGRPQKKYLALQGRKKQWFAIVLPDDDDHWAADNLRENLKTRAGKVTGSWDGVLRGVPTGPEWYRLKRVPILIPTNVYWVEKEDKGPTEAAKEFDVVGEAVGESLDPRIQGEMDSGDSAIVEEASDKVLYKVVDIQKENLNIDPIFERYSPWSLVHLLYHNGEWLLSNPDYERVENWDRKMRNQYDTFESPSVHQAVVGDFIGLLGYDKAKRVGIVFNGEDGIPRYRWIPQKSDVEASEGGPADRGAEADPEFLEKLADLKKASKGGGHVQNQILGALLSDRKSLAQGVICRTRNKPILIQPAQGIELFGGESSEALRVMYDLLSLTQAEEIVFRVQPVWIDQIQRKFGKPDNLKSDPYPFTLTGDDGEMKEIHPGSPQWPSIVWHVYGGIQIGKTNSMVETFAPNEASVAVLIDIPKWRRLNRPRGLSRQ